MRDLDMTRKRGTVAGNGWNVTFIDLTSALLYARIATGEASGSLATALRNPGFVLRHARGAGKRGRAALEDLAATLDARGAGGYVPLVEFELAKLALHEERLDDARTHLDRVEQLLAHEPDATLVRDATELLANR